jgi:putative DNA primase/helicase
MQCSPEFPAVGMTVAAASLVGRKFGIRPKRYDDWLELCNLWGLQIAPVAMLKTPTLQQSVVPLRRLVAKAWEAFEKEEHEYAVNEMLRVQRKKLLEENLKKDLKGKKDADAREKVEQHLREASEKPVCHRYEVNDVTIPKLGELLAQNPNGLLYVRDEIHGFWRALDREEHAGDRAAYLEMWDGKGELTYDRIGRGTIRVPSNTLSMLGTIQPDLLVPYVRESVRGGRGNDGFIQRYQLAVSPDPPREWKNVDRWPDSEAKAAAFALFEYLDQLSAQDVGANIEEKGIPFLRFTPDAEECFNDWRAQLEKQLRSGVDHPAFTAHIAKYRKLVPALSLFNHVADRKLGPVSLAAIERALLWAKCLETHARRIYSAALRPDMAAARELAKHLQHRDLPERFSLREVYRKCWAGLSEKEDAEAASEILCDLGWIRPAVDAPKRPLGAPGRGPSPTFEMNPQIFKVPIDPTDKTDTINSVGSVSGLLRHSKSLDPSSVSSVSDYPEVTGKSEASNSADHPQSSEHLSTPPDKTDTIPEQGVGWV